MNIDNVNEELVMPTDWTDFFNRMFSRQTELMHKYEGIEEKNGVRVPRSPWHLDDKFVQYRIKDFFWRVTEELAEAMEVRSSVIVNDEQVYLMWLDKWEASPDVRHFFEELSDALHFLAEVTMICGVRTNSLGNACSAQFDHKRVHTGESRYTEQALCVDVAAVIFEIGLAANLLKNKPWKNTHMATDITEFRNYIVTTWLNFIKVWLKLGCERDFIYTIYMKKSRVNQWRQKTNY